MMNKILRSTAMLALCGGLSREGYSSTSSGLSSPIDSEGFAAEQKRAMQQTAMAKLADTEPKTKKANDASRESQIKADKIDVKAADGSKAAFVAGKSSDAADIKLGEVAVSAEGQSKAAAILNKSGGMSSDIEASNVSVNATGISQAYGFVDDASDW